MYTAPVTGPKKNIPFKRLRNKYNVMIVGNYVELAMCLFSSFTKKCEQFLWTPQIHMGYVCEFHQISGKLNG